MPEAALMVYWIVARPTVTSTPHRDTRLGPFDSRFSAERALEALGTIDAKRYAIVCDYS